MNLYVGVGSLPMVFLSFRVRLGLFCQSQRILASVRFALVAVAVP